MRLASSIPIAAYLIRNTQSVPDVLDHLRDVNQMGRAAGIITFLVGGVLTGQVGSIVQNQTAPANHSASEPIYRITVLSRTTKAINYGHRTQPTKVDFKGTVLMSAAHGEAIVQGKRGVVEIKTAFNHVDAPTKFGPEYLTYVLWAISPEGRPINLGELVLNSSNKGKLAVSSDLQSFALIVTAEPYFSVTRPSDVVVMENVVRPDTVGKVEEMDAKYELLPRKQFTYDPAANSGVSDGPKIPFNQYEATLALYQAQNALQIAEAAGANRYATDTFEKAIHLYHQAQTYYVQKAATKQVVTSAREAAQAAEDARAITVRRQQAQSNAGPQ